MPATCEDSVLVALSGGVDSSVAVWLLQRQGYEVEGLVLCLSPAHESTVLAAQQAAEKLGIRLHVLRDFALFEREVITPFAQEYRSGRTPNPCVVCNPEVKFALLRQKADELGFQWIATGHYAGVREQNGRFAVCKAEYLPRDQSYMLYRLTQRQLSHLLLPLQALPKSEVRRIAEKQQLPCAALPDSQEICFIPDNDYAAYLEERYGTLPEGDFISPQGEVCGRHRGILHYTVGQRKGLGIALGRPVFVSSIDAEQNCIYLAESGEEYAVGIRLSGCCFFSPQCEGAPFQAGVKIRSMAKEAAATVTPLADGTAEVRFEQPQRAPAPGQSAVFYCGDLVLGGGFIEKALD